MQQFSVDDAIFALATPWGESAIAVIRVSGTDSLTQLDTLIRCRDGLAGAAGYSMHHGRFLNPQSGETIDEIMIAVYRSPHGYTGEDGAELFTHGSPTIVTLVMDILMKAGFRQAAPGEFTQRAFLNGKIDLTRAEAVNELIRARSDRARALALTRLSGALEQRITAIKEEIADLLAAVEILIDYPDEAPEEQTGSWLETVQAIEMRIERLLATYQTGRIIQEGITAVIAGRTNAGKSTLFNLLLREDRAIVSDVHGTTRDYLEGTIVIHGVPIRLFDTAGLRKTDSPLELEGIRRTDRLLEGADLILLVIDGTSGLTDEEKEFLGRFDRRKTVLKLWNKTDCAGRECPMGFIPISARSGGGIDLLNEKVEELCIRGNPLETGEPVIDSLRQKQLLEQCTDSLAAFKNGLANELPLDLLAVDLKGAMDSLGEITGAISTEELLQRMFSRFCVGK